ncbi:MAG: hypothetical protein AB1505_08975 [Candidatus Latescibacterota bacterium]
MLLARDGPARSRPRVVSLERPFSNFHFVDTEYAKEHRALRRLFSRARAARARTLVIEDIAPAGAIADEQAALRILDPSHHSPLLQRLTFWSSSSPDGVQLPQVSSRNLLGYALVKKDVLPALGECRLHVFESVFRKHDHPHNCVPGSARYPLCALGKSLVVTGVMYCQQNALTKACAQVALRSLLSLFHPRDDVPYSRINQIAEPLAGVPFNPADGLDSDQLVTVIEAWGHSVRQVNYELPGVVASDYPYDQWLYGAIESGCAGLIGFELSGAAAGVDRHIVPFFGHTFNQDTWAPKALGAYFHVGDNLRYISSLQWMSSFIGHDDNFGSDYCIPRHFVRPEHVKFVAAVLPQRCAYHATQAEALALQYLYSSLPDLFATAANPWVRRIVEHVTLQEVVLRPVAVRRRQYLSFLARARDWDQCREDPVVLAALGRLLPSHLWVVEISLPDLFAANHRKVGEIVLDSQVPARAPAGSRHLVLLRLPQWYLVPGPRFPARPEFHRLPSALTSHTSVFRYRGRLW